MKTACCKFSLVIQRRSLLTSEESRALLTIRIPNGCSLNSGGAGTDRSDNRLCRHERFRSRIFSKHLLDASEGLPRALFILDERKPHVAIAVVTEAYAGAY